MTKMWASIQYSEFHILGDLLWSTVYHNAFGECFTANLSRIEGFEYVSYKVKLGKDQSSFIFKTNVFYSGTNFPNSLINTGTLEDITKNSNSCASSYLTSQLRVLVSVGAVDAAAPTDFEED